MMRENMGVFRGKDTIEHKWRYGNLIVHRDTAQIWEDTEQGLMNCLVDPETVGEYTGLTDSNGTGIFEGDILCSLAAKRKVISVVKIGAFKPDFFYDYAHEHGYDMSVKVYGLYAYVASDREDIMFAADMKLASVIGNIHENPELLEGKNNEQHR